LSIDGKSSWMRDIVWIISRATAAGIDACQFPSPANISHAARHSTGRIRFPPAMSEYFIASTIFSVCGSRHGTDSSSAFSMYGNLSAMYEFKSNFDDSFVFFAAVLLLALPFFLLLRAEEAVLSSASLGGAAVADDRGRVRCGADEDDGDLPLLAKNARVLDDAGEKAETRVFVVVAAAANNRKIETQFLMMIIL